MAAMALSVPTMTSRQAVRVVTARLRDVPGVETVQADATAAMLVVDGDVSEQHLRMALASAGFPAAPGPALSP